MKTKSNYRSGLSIPDNYLKNTDCNLGAVVLFSTNDYDYFELCINNLLECNINNIVIVTYTHMWNGDSEDSVLLDKCRHIYQSDKRIEFINIPWVPNMHSFYFENIGREMGVSFLKDKCDYVLLIDTDEIIDPYIFSIWINTYDIKDYKAIAFKQYFYAKSAIYRAKSCKDYNIIMFNTKYVNEIRTGNARRRFMNFDSKLTRWLTKFGLHKKYKLQKDNLIFIHHYSWVKTKSQLIKKVNNWGHRNDSQNWLDIINELFDGNKITEDYEIVENKFNININL